MRNKDKFKRIEVAMGKIPQAFKHFKHTLDGIKEDASANGYRRVYIVQLLRVVRDALESPLEQALADYFILTLYEDEDLPKELALQIRMAKSEDVPPHVRACMLIKAYMELAVLVGEKRGKLQQQQEVMAEA